MPSLNHWVAETFQNSKSLQNPTVSPIFTLKDQPQNGLLHHCILPQPPRQWPNSTVIPTPVCHFNTRPLLLSLPFVWCPYSTGSWLSMGLPSLIPCTYIQAKPTIPVTSHVLYLPLWKYKGQGKSRKYQYLKDISGLGTTQI